MDPESKAGSTAKVDVAASKEAEEGPLFFCYTSPSDEGYFLSPWYKSNFEVDGVTYKCAGQYIVADMARTAGDEKTLQKIMEADGADTWERLTIEVKNYDGKAWVRRAADVAKTANLHKFMSENAESRDLLKKLKSLGNRELVYADPWDMTLGIAHPPWRAKLVPRERWGQNIFGKSLHAVRDATETLETGNTMKSGKPERSLPEMKDCEHQDANVSSKSLDATSDTGQTQNPPKREPENSSGQKL